MLKHNFSRFIKDIEKQIKEKQKKSKIVLQKTALNFLEEVREASPVVTGRYKAGHILSKDSPSKEVPGESRSESGGNGQTINLEDTGDEKIFVTNNLDYAEVIEYGGQNRTAHLVYTKSAVKNKRFFENEKKKQGFK